ncbi:hypothetical protein ABL78_4277 [Leptomonas seymouri]|uniref:Uncharacterized protein n=1 Tax=Leptomonas seymouri TaxID=5684 RepID=A0A0N1PE87_LEPSE|nr:hypothetical protein ABL78_4277 [Leptomonas seymouri]|eukprot:KPI86662.1 hypothetical protein ABL78_4277 [Leptomonas seymouri]
MDPDRKLAEKEAREMIADAGSSLAQRYVRESLKKNRFALVLFAVAIVTPAFFLITFYTAKAREIRANFRDPYALPEGFDPKTGEFGSKDAEVKSAQKLPMPSPLLIGDEPGNYGQRSRKHSIM